MLHWRQRTSNCKYNIKVKLERLFSKREIERRVPLSGGGGGANQKVFFSRSIAVLRHKNERNLSMMLQNTLFSVF